MPDPAEARNLWPAVETSPGIELYNGVTTDFNGAFDLDAGELERKAKIGMLRVGPGGRAVVGRREPWGENLAVDLVPGSVRPTREVLISLRFLAHADGLHQLHLRAPADSAHAS